jgi:antitoxin CcdA
MELSATNTRRKRAVNRALSLELVEEAKALSTNLSATVEAMLAEYVARERQTRAHRRQAAADLCGDWNAMLAAAGGSYADAHSTL